jgi:beta-hydroxylase
MKKRVEVGLALVAVLVIIIVACAEAMRRRGDVRGSVRDAMLVPTLPLAPYNLWAVKHTCGGDAPYADMALHFPNHGVLRDNWAVIRDEALAAYRGGHASKIRGERYFGPRADERWKKFYIKWYDDVLPDARARCPKTCALLDRLPELHLAMFSILEPGARIPPHVSPFAGNLRYHLGLQCPAGASIKVDGTPYRWADGHDVLFDGSFVHEVTNDADGVRVILFADVERKLDAPWAQAVHNRVCKLAGPASNKANNRNETPVDTHLNPNPVPPIT